MPLMPLTTTSEVEQPSHTGGVDPTFVSQQTGASSQVGLFPVNFTL